MPNKRDFRAKQAQAWARRTKIMWEDYLNSKNGAWESYRMAVKKARARYKNEDKFRDAKKRIYTKYEGRRVKAWNDYYNRITEPTK